MYMKMAEILEEQECGKFKIEKFSISENNIRAMLDGISKGVYARLINAGECIMSDTNMEKRTNSEFCSKAL